MKQRKYSVAEIDEMRGHLVAILYYSGVDGKHVEDRLRTYMLNGTDPEELKLLYEEKHAVVMEKNERWLEQQQ